MLISTHVSVGVTGRFPQCYITDSAVSVDYKSVSYYLYILQGGDGVKHHPQQLRVLNDIGYMEHLHRSPTITCMTGIACYYNDYIIVVPSSSLV